MPEKIRQFCKQTGQTVPEDKAETVRCIMESLALKYRMTLEELEEIAGYSIPILHIVGGGCKNVMLCRFTANAVGRPVIAGPVEATAIGNIVCQLIALGQVSGLDQAREIVKKSFPVSEYMPDGCSCWDDAYERFRSISGTGI